MNSGESVTTAIRFSLALAPDTILKLDLGSLMRSARNAISAVFARPSVGGTATAIFNRSP